MTTFIEDSARNTMPGWAIEAVQAGFSRGAVLSPFTSPRIGNNYKVSAKACVERLQDGGAEVWFDPETHALQMPSVGDFRHYDDWPLWTGNRGELRNVSEMRGHVERVFAEQDYLGVPHLAPSILLHSAQSGASQVALDLARIAVELDPQCRLSMAGDAAFWASGRTLDAHVGALAQLEPSGWWLTVARNVATLPVQVIPEEVHGLCRTARALSEDGPVHIAHGDMAGLPAIAAGASTVGTGWDTRQRVSCYPSYEVRDSSGESQGQWFQQVTFEGLLSQLTQGDTQVVTQQDGRLAARLIPGTVAPGPKEAFMHHVAVLARRVEALRVLSPDFAYIALDGLYDRARADWAATAAALGTTSRADAWVTPLQDGLRLYGATEGF